MMDEGQLKDEIRLFKECFTGAERLLKSTRSLLIGLDVSDEEKERIKAAFSKNELREIVRHRVFQRITDDVPLGAINDQWVGLDARLQGASMDAITQAIKVRSRLIKLFDQIESYLENPFQEKIDLKVDEKHIENSINLSETACDIMARNLYVKSVDMVMAIIWSLVKEKEESPEQALERLKKNSTK